MSGLVTSTASQIRPLSPSSPPLRNAKSPDRSQVSQQTPQTPTSPPPMSVSNASTFASTQPSTTTATSASPSQPLSSPPSSAPMSAQVSQQAFPAPHHALPTPVSSTSGPLIGNAHMDDTDVHANITQAPNPRDEPGSTQIQNPDLDEMDVDRPEHPRTDHDRQDAESVVQGDAASQTDPGQAATADQSMADVEPSLVSAASEGEISLEQLQKNMGEAFLLCRTLLRVDSASKIAHLASQPQPAQQLLSLYGLSPLVATVARTDPKTGEKINKLRKSYEGKLKDFGLAGKNKPVKQEDPRVGLRSLMMWPDEEWHNQKVYGKKIGVSSNMASKLQTAMKMEVGRMPDHDGWEEKLGHEKPVPIQAPEVAKKQGIVASASQRQANGVAAPAAGSAAQELARPKRAGKKRSYNDSSFVGYGEGFVDDEGDLDFSNSDDGRRASGKKRKKEHTASTPIMERGGYSSYGIGAR